MGYLQLGQEDTEGTSEGPKLHRTEQPRPICRREGET